jgi:predicted nucleic acid-binding protein
MTAIDTNVLVRILTHDEPQQTEKALALHLSLTERRADRFCTFDRALAQSPGSPASPAVILL